MRCKDDTAKAVESIVTLIRDTQGNATGFRNIGRDVTARKKMEEEQDRGADLTRQLLGYARGERYEVKPVHLNEIVEKSAIMFGRTKKEIIIEQDLAQDLWIVDADRGQMEQVILNLLVNAWHAMPGGGEIFLRTRNVVLEMSHVRSLDVSPGPYVKLTVKDTGVGMDEMTRERLFEPFFTTKEMGRVRGTGLGLASVYGIIKGHRARSMFKVKEGRVRPSIFIFRLLSRKLLVNRNRER